jgi:hypothetical protein
MNDDFDDYDDFYEDIIEKFKKYFKFDADLHDVDFLFIPEPIDFDKDLQDKNIKGFKVSYHYESGMDKPEIRIEGDVDDNEIRKYLKGAKLQRNPRFRLLKGGKNQNKEIDASTFALAPCNDEEENCSLEPYSEIYHLNDSIEIILEVPGIEKGH